MPPVTVPAVAAQEIPHLAVLIIAAVVAGALVRVVLCILAAFAVRKALSDTGEDTVAIRAHHLAVLQMILGALARQAPQKPPSDDQPLHKHEQSAGQATADSSSSEEPLPHQHG